MRHSPLNPPPELLTALGSVADAMVGVRAQMHALQAVESLLLHSGELLARQIATAGGERNPSTSSVAMAYRTVHTEIAAAVHESDLAVNVKMGRATELVERYPAVYRALSAGKVSATHVARILDAGSVIEDESARGAFEAEVLEYAEAETASRLRPVAKQLAEKHTGLKREERFEQARTQRCVFVVEREDGMADLTAHLSAPYAYGIKDRLDQLVREELDERARAAKDAAGDADTTPDTRTADELRADLFVDALLGSDFDRLRTAGAPASNFKARVQVIVPVRQLDTGAGVTGSAVKQSRDVATLEGYGPIGDQEATDIAAHAECWEVVTVDGDAGTVLKVDSYRPSAQQRRFLGARDLHCRFLGCRATLAWCDIDHTVDAALGGPTSSDNLGYLCRRHHTLKHASPWTVEQDTQGNFSWTSPAGRSYTDRPESRVRFRPAEEFEGTDPPTPPSLATEADGSESGVGCGFGPGFGVGSGSGSVADSSSSSDGSEAAEDMPF